MADICVWFACGHPAAALGRADEMDSVQCAVCGERRVQSVTAPPPRIRAVDCEASGPHVVKG